MASCVAILYLLQKDFLEMVDKADRRNLGILPDRQKAVSRYLAAVACFGLVMVVNGA